MTRRKAFLIVLVLWAVIYLPGMGSTELKGEEGRRILPAITMLETGNWLVPYVGGKPFLRKPPLMNWLIALSFKATGVRNEWSARLPSVLAVLALAGTIVVLARPRAEAGGKWWMTPGTAVIAAVMTMTAFGLLSKARFAGAEIEGVYVPLFGIAIAGWLAWRARGASPWVTWTVPFVFLGLGALAKGPLHVLFFYGIVAAVLWVEKQWRALFHPAHVVGVLIMSGIFAAWAVPYFRAEATGKASKVWRDQIANRVVENRFDWKSYVTNLPRGVADLLPWVLLAPAVIPRLRGYRSERDAGEEAPHEEAEADGSGRVRRMVLLSCAGMYLTLLLVPGVLPRYVLPLGVPLALMLAVYLSERQRGWVWKGSIALCVASLIYGTVGVRLIAKHDDLRLLASEVDAAIAPGAELIVYDPGYQPALFYVRSRYSYAPYLEDIPADVRFVLARAKDRKKLTEKRPNLAVTREFRRKGELELILLEPVRSRPGLAARACEPAAGFPASAGYSRAPAGCSRAPAQWFRVPAQRFRVPAQRFRVPAQWFRVPAQRFRVPAQWFRVPAQWFRVPAQWFRVPAQWFRVPAQRFRVPAQWFRVPAQCFRVPAQWFRTTCGVLSTTCGVVRGPVALFRGPVRLFWEPFAPYSVEPAVVFCLSRCIDLDTWPPSSLYGWAPASLPCTTSFRTPSSCLAPPVLHFRGATMSFHRKMGIFGGSDQGRFFWTAEVLSPIRGARS